MYKLFGIILTVIFLITTLRVEAKISEEQEAFLTPYTKLLSKYVAVQTKNNIKSTGINYLAWQSDPLHEEALSNLSKVAIQDITLKEEKISFWINVYNFLTIDLIIKQGEQKTIHNLGGLVGDPWNEFAWILDGLEFTLGQIHHQTLRLINEPRVHFTLTCAAVSCPDLKRTPYHTNKIYSQLEKQTKKFLKSKEKGVIIIEPKQGKSKIKKHKIFKISEMFQWFKSDFDGGSVERFISRYIDVDGAKFDGYIEHDWSLNALKNKEPKKREAKKKVSAI